MIVAEVRCTIPRLHHGISGEYPYQQSSEANYIMQLLA